MAIIKIIKTAGAGEDVEEGSENCYVSLVHQAHRLTQNPQSCRSPWLNSVGHKTNIHESEKGTCRLESGVDRVER